MRNSYLSALYSLAKENKQVLALVADNGAIVYDDFRRDFPDQFINFGISEANMIGAAAGLASCGKVPFAYTIIPFLTMRAYEQIRNDVCLQDQNVKLVGIGAGFVYSTLGPTHHAIEDIAIMRVLPNMTVISPASPREAAQATIAAVQHKGPVYLRLGTTKEPEIYDNDYSFEIGRGVVLRDGSDVAIIGTGSVVHNALLAVDSLASQGISARVINIHTIKPIDRELIIKAAYETGAVITVEEHSIIGGLGGAVAEILAECSLGRVAFDRMGLNDCFCQGYGNHDLLKEINGLSPVDIERSIINALNKKASLK
ncbi:MAG: transketolase family protein [Acidobacteriota bacterium]